MAWESKVQKKSFWNSAPVEKSMFSKERVSRRRDDSTDNIVQKKPIGLTKGHNFNILDLKSSPVQAKLTVGAPDDKYEQEADNMASQVMSMPDSAIQQQPESSISLGDSKTIQCEEDQELASAIDKGKAVPDTIGAIKDVYEKVGGSVDPTVSSGMNIAGAALDFGANKAAGQSTGEAVGGAVGSFAASELVSYNSVDSTVKAVNSVAKALGTPEAVTNLTQVASDMMPSSFIGAGLGNAGRGVFNAVTGNTKALDKQFTDVADGKSGAALQGYALAPQVIAQSIATGDVESAFLRVGSQGKGSPIEKIGSWLGEKTYQLLHGDETVQPKLTLGQSTIKGNVQTGSNFESWLSNSKGGGSPLPDEVRSFMEPRFGADFSQVRVHTGSEAMQMNRDLNAQAFTHKQDVYFGTGKAPAKDVLTAHELTHVVQQTGSIRTKENMGGLIQRTGLEEEQVYTPPDANISTPEGTEVKVDPPAQTSEHNVTNDNGAGGASNDIRQTHQGGAEGAPGSEQPYQPSDAKFLHDSLSFMGTFLPPGYAVVPNALNATAYLMEGNYGKAASTGISAVTGGLPEKYKKIKKWGGIVGNALNQGSDWFKKKDND